MFVSVCFQAREDVIFMLKSQQTSPETLESQYGCAVPASALKALQRDSFITGTKPDNHSVYQKPMVEVGMISLYFIKLVFCVLDSSKTLLIKNLTKLFDLRVNLNKFQYEFSPDLKLITVLS